MEENKHGTMPKNDGESTPANPALDHDKNGSEQTATKPAADKNNSPSGSKMHRRTDAELLATLKKKMADVAKKQRDVKERLEKKRAKELVKLKIVIGDSCLHYLKTVGNPEHATRLIDLLRRCAIERDKSWVKEHLDRLLKEHSDPKPKQDGANGESPSPS